MAHKAPGPTGPNETWVEGDHYHHAMGCVELDADQAADLNRQLAEHRAAVMAAELTRFPFDKLRACPKCGTRLTTLIVYKGENADCAHDHGATEHFDRQCLYCLYTWAEHLP